MSDFDVRTSFVRLTLDIYTSEWSSPSPSSTSTSSPSWWSVCWPASLSGHHLSVWPFLETSGYFYLWLSFVCLAFSHLLVFNSFNTIFLLLVVIPQSGLFTFEGFVCSPTNVFVVIVYLSAHPSFLGFAFYLLLFMHIVVSMLVLD